MKKLKILMSCFICLMLSGCGNKKSAELLKIKSGAFKVEFGDTIDLGVETYLDTNKLDENEKKKVLTESTLSVSISQDDLITKDNKSYPKVGTYDGMITYQEEIIHFNIEVKDTIAPIISGADEITITKGETLDITKHFTATDLSELKDWEVDLSTIDHTVVGSYSTTITIEDIYDNAQSKKITVHVEEVKTPSVPGNNETNPTPDKTPNPPSTNTETDTTPTVVNSVKLNVPYFNQMDVNAPMGCEATSLYMALKFKGYIDSDLKTFINNVPRADSPHSGFSGDPFTIDPDEDAYQGIFPGPLTTYGNQYGTCVNISGASLETIMEELRNNHPVVAYVTLDFAKPIVKEYSFGSGVDNGHVVLVVGFDLNRNVFYIQDPYRSNLKEVSMDSFKGAYSTLKYAVSIH